MYGARPLKNTAQRLKGNVPLCAIAISGLFLLVCLWLYTLLQLTISSEDSGELDNYPELAVKPDVHGLIFHTPRPWPKEVKGKNVSLTGEASSRLQPSVVQRVTGEKIIRIFSRLVSSTKSWKKLFGYSGEVMAFDCLKDALVELGHDLVESTLPAPHKLHTPHRRRMAMRAYEPLCKDHWDILLVEYNRIDEAWSHPCVKSSGVLFAVLDFYGHTARHVHRMLSTSSYLTMYPEAENTFLGFYVKPESTSPPDNQREMAGVIWGKRKEYFTPTVVKTLNALLDTFPDLVLHATVADKKKRPITVPGLSSKVQYHGVMKHEEFVRMLRKSRFVMGLGHPLYGPTALEALSLGCRYFNFVHKDVFRHPMGSNFSSQHDYLGRLELSHPDQVCNFDIFRRPESLHSCVRKALNGTAFNPFVPKDFQWKNFVPRVGQVFHQLVQNKELYKKFYTNATSMPTMSHSKS